MDENMQGEGDVGDSKGFFWRSKPELPTPTVHLSPDVNEYFMKHPKRGKCLIFNNKNFDPHTKLNVRKGTEADAISLNRCFRELDFDVAIHEDFDARKITETLKSVAKEDHSSSDCFVCCILTHGDQGILFGRDGKFPTEHVFAPFRGDASTSLAGKPKLFFIQACQGDQVDRGTSIMYKHSADSGSVTKIPTQADFLICYSTVPGFYSWRNTYQGSWFIQALCQVFETHHKNMDLLEMMTVVNRKVAIDYQSCVPNDPNMDQMKQVPCVTSTLTRKIYFHMKF